MLSFLPLLGVALMTTVSVTGASSASAQIKPAGPAVLAELPMTVYQKRRARLLKELGGCATVIKSQSTDDKLDQDFFYLTGIEEAGVSLVLAPRARTVVEQLDFPIRNPKAEIWTGYRELINTKARKKYLVDEVRETPRPGLGRTLRAGLRRGKCYAHLRFPGSPQDVPAQKLGNLLKGYGARSVQQWSTLETMRVIKDADEITRMRKAIAITFKGHEAAVRALTPGVIERQVSVAIREGFYRHGATGLAFPSIVGSGPNGAVLHWFKNSREVVAGDMAVIDIGAEYGHYAADITRTYPISGTFSAEQKKIYEIVFRVQNEIIAMVKPGISLNQLHRATRARIEAAGYELPHYFGHFVGLDVHDVGDPDAPLEAGMVITVEPGIYLKGKFGVRIEDMVLVTARGGELLSKDLPRSPDELVAWMEKIRIPQ